LQAVELDRDLIPRLEKLCADQGELTIHSADALKFDFSALCAENEKLRLVGNLPYNISTPLIFHLLQSVDKIHDMHFMLQYEVVQRMAATPGGRDYGRLSVMCQYYCQVQALFTVRPGAFNPPPKVNSAIVRLTPHTEPLVEVGDVALFAKLVRQAFSQRRKTLRNTLKTLLSADQIEACDIDPSVRAETLSLAQFATLSCYYSEHVS
ncbi:MAG: 16S rRNA (adenine(1518)-N(6)/adenine(1519)-N(6))-dimethyltransferase RsmA, partial [Gammaproteobacteria bacterium]|nr:16S rRNA (adenine(1518)-N(6)/adenine(1519)-N(6))-dimethyltransferase RsmA [Gammaproteobacteria bacterium]